MKNKQSRSSISNLFKTEDYWAIWLGFTLLIIGMLIYFPNPPDNMNEIFSESNRIMEQESETIPFKTIEYHEALDAKEGIRGRNIPAGKFLADLFKTPQGWKTNPLRSLFLNKSSADKINAEAKDAYHKAVTLTKQAKESALAVQVTAKNEGYGDDTLNQKADIKVNEWLEAKGDENAAKRKQSVKSYNLIISLIVLMIAFGLFFSVGIFFMGKGAGKFLIGFPFVFLIAIIAYVLASQSTMKSYGIGDAAWAIIIGMLISNTVGTPGWVKPSLQVEFFIKTGLVLLGAELLINKIIAIGLPGLCVAWIVTPVVLVSTYVFGQKVLKIESKSLNMVVSADMSVCGTSAAIAAAAACNAKKEELTLSIGLSLVFTAIMMIVLPAVIKATGMPFILGGAWMGGTIDATGAVAAAGAFLSEEALYVAATIKMIQNMLIGVIAFGIAVYWTMKVEATQGQKVGLSEIWVRFPKFILGFLAASIIFTLIDTNLGNDTGYALIDQGVLRGFTRYCRGWFFTLAFVAIGLATNFRELAHHFKGGKPFVLYFCGQSLNLILTLIMAYIMFYLVFPDITASI